MQQVLMSLADLYAAAHYLPTPDIDPASNYPEGSFDLTQSEYQAVLEWLVHMLDQERLYAYYFDVIELPSDPQLLSVGDLADDLADIYRDIKPGLLAWSTNIDDYFADIILCAAPETCADANTGQKPALKRPPSPPPRVDELVTCHTMRSTTSAELRA
jgi:hypothetical protein